MLSRVLSARLTARGRLAPIMRMTSVESLCPPRTMLAQAYHAAKLVPIKGGKAQHRTYIAAVVDEVIAEIEQPAPPGQEASESRTLPPSQVSETVDPGTLESPLQDKPSAKPTLKSASKPTRKSATTLKKVKPGNRGEFDLYDYGYIRSTNISKYNQSSNGPLPKGTTTTRATVPSLSAMYNQLHKMGQNPRQGPKSTELLVKCPKCRPRPERHNYTAHLDKTTGRFVCTKCLTQGSWSDYKKLVKGNPHFHLESVSSLMGEGQPRIGSDPFDRPLGDVVTYMRNLPQNPVVYQCLTGEGADQHRLRPETLEQFMVGLTYLNTNPATIDSAKDAIHSTRAYERDEMTHTFHGDGSEGSQDIFPFLVFPRTAINDSVVDGVTKRTGSIGTAASSSAMAALDSVANDAATTTTDDPAELSDSDLASSSSPSSTASSSVPALLPLAGHKVTRFRALSFPGSEHVVFDPVRNNQPGLFGLHLAPVDADTLILTGTELDAMAAYQETGIPSVALPANAFQLPLEEMRILDRFSRIYVWLDDDMQGQEAALRLVNKLGIDRTLMVASRGGLATGPINASAALRGGHSFQAILDMARPLGHEQILDFNTLRDAVQQEVLHPVDVAGVRSRDLTQYNKILKGLRPGELTIVSGTTGVGKTTILSHLSLDFCQSGVSTLWGSFEIPNVRLAKRMLYQFSNKDLSQHPEEFDYWADKFEQLPLHFLKFFGSTEASTVIETMKHAVYAYDVQHVLIDNLQFMMTGQGRGYEKWDLQEAAMNTFRKFATENNVHVTLVVHPRKERDDKGMIDINSVFGSAKITQDSDNVVLIQKVAKVTKSQANEFGDALPTRYLDVQKNRFDGTLGKIYLSFDNTSLQVRGASPPPPTTSPANTRTLTKFKPKSTAAAATPVVTDVKKEADSNETTATTTTTTTVAESAVKETKKSQRAKKTKPTEEVPVGTPAIAASADVKAETAQRTDISGEVTSDDGNSTIDTPSELSG